MTNEELILIANAASKGDIETMGDILKQASGKVDFQDYTLKNTVSQLIRHNHYEILNQFIQKGILSTDLYDYDRLDTAVIDVLVRPQVLAEDALTDYLDWLRGYLTQIDDIDEEVASVTLLEHALTVKAPVSILKTIVDAGADLHRTDQYGQTLLFKVCNLRMQDPQRICELIDWLLAEGVDPNAANVEQKTPLHVAVDTVKIEAVEKLLQAGADPNLADWNGETVFYYAVARQFNATLLEKLLHDATPDFHRQTKQGENLLNAFLRMIYNDSEQNVKIVNLLLEHGADLKEASLWYQREKTGVDWLAERSAALLENVMERGYLDVDYRDNLGNTLLHKVCQVELNYDENKARDLYRKVKYLIQQGINPQIENTEDKKAVDYAMADNLKVKTVEWLLKQ
ncbi:hypothetical protein GCM10023231_13330 [Olivibacter ginsenosidimutans]|uniref:Ankyrin repeat domain-containing protein n=1 Tax=Olivibacter ginsenosidimutans TaxID=1176537 RepID=A0ABP9AY19_9SPHI